MKKERTLKSERERINKYNSEHRDKKKEANAKWNAKNRNEYQRAYYLKQKKLST